LPVALFHVDAFASEPFTGNPAAVCLLDAPADEQWMQAVAAEMNLSETAFVVPRADGEFDLRWFTPTVEAELCGHATLATAHALWETGTLGPDDEARFHTRFRGALSARRRGHEIELDFPADPLVPVEPDPALAAALGAEPIGTSRGEIGWFVELSDERTVRRLAPDLRALTGFGTVVVTARADTGAYDFVSRFFLPGYGIPEDPVTGSAHCALGPFWASRLGREELRGYQASARGGFVNVRVEGDRVRLGGEAVTVLRGELLRD
jgi:predicted PhzF superfamily epimerase YddE/YHI9